MLFFTEKGAASSIGDQEEFFFHLHDLGSNADIWQQGVTENFSILSFFLFFKGAITSGRGYQLTYFCRHWLFQDLHW